MPPVEPLIASVFQPLFGQPCWGVKQGCGSFITFEFGKPHQRIHPVRRLSSSDHPHRAVVIRGDWHLWIYCCGWRIKADEVELAHSESQESQISIACGRLDGQALQNVELQLDVGRSRFEFDLGGLLETGPVDGELHEQWMLYCPDGRVFTYRSDGAVSFGPGNLKADEVQWMRAG
ncbi:MAG TPA: hypothetical protein VG722_06375 [Tepidisphaeraceae bacterium]|nr:hypothetical protein [Tepidisphaeraceae bacterium]